MAAIRRGYAGGMRMNEIDLATSLGVSRTPIRGALSTLAAEGLLDYTPNSGYAVRSYSSKDIAATYEVRIALEAGSEGDVDEDVIAAAVREREV